MVDEPNDRKTARAPTGRLERFARLSSAASGVAARLAGQRVIERLLPKEKRGASRQRALEKSGEQIVRVMGNLKGAAMKVGQMLSIDPEVIPAEIQDALATLQREAPAMDYELVVAQIEAALDRKIYDVFRFFEPDPIGAASVGQVHRAETFDGRVVAVKVQYPGIADTIDSDLKNLGSLLSLAGVVAERERIDAYMAEVRDVLIEESDYVHEAHNLERYGELLSRYEGLVVPRPDLERTARTVLTMDYVEGVKFDDHLSSLSDVEERNRLAEQLITLMASMFHDLQIIHADPHPGNFLVDPAGRLVLLDFGCVRSFPRAFTDGILDIMSCVWEGDAEGLKETYRRLDFGRGDFARYDADALYELSELVLAPFLNDAPFDFGAWEVQERIRRFMLEHYQLASFTPPREALLYLRVLAGLRGLMVRLKVTFNSGRMGREIAHRHGRWEW